MKKVAVTRAREEGKKIFDVGQKWVEEYEEMRRVVKGLSEGQARLEQMVEAVKEELAVVRGWRQTEPVVEREMPEKGEG